MMTDEPLRPNPDRLLEHTAEAHREKLKISSPPAPAWAKPGPRWRKRSGFVRRVWRGGGGSRNPRT
ncbi:hypothetical protein ACLK2H_04105 [Escherichia coli]